MKKLLIISIAIFIPVAVGVAIGLFLYPFPPNEPPQANDIGSTEQGIQKVANANNQFAFELFDELDEEPDKNIFFCSNHG